ncbi:MAG: amidohydrolase family protein [Gemmatimonadetes bacterium]|nr:amidohydrolase family protein [Gemmatimonadota bacterium]
MRSIAILLALAAAAAPLAPVATAQTPAPPTVIRAARMLDVVAGRMVANATVVVENGRISAVNPATMPRNAKVVDLGDVTLLPGFIDLHTHLSSEISAGAFTRAVTNTLADEALGAAANGIKTVMAGFTTVRDFGGDATVALGHAVERGTLVGPRVVPARESIGITGGHCDVTGFAPGVREQLPEDGIGDGPWSVVRAVRYQIKHGAQVIKICATAGVLSLEGPVGAQQLADEELQAIVAEASRHGVRVAAHAHGNAGIKAAVRAGVTTIEHGSELDDEAIALMKQRGTYLVPTTYLVDRINLAVLPPLVRSKAEQILPIARESLRKAIAAGVKVAFGTDAGVYPHGENAREFALYVKFGMTPLAALRAGTVVATEALGRTDRGAIEAGKLADLVAVPGDPLQDITATERPSWVMLGGRVVKGAEPR